MSTRKLARLWEGWLHYCSLLLQCLVGQQTIDMKQDVVHGRTTALGEPTARPSNRMQGYH